MKKIKIVQIYLIQEIIDFCFIAYQYLFDMFTTDERKYPVEPNSEKLKKWIYILFLFFDNWSA